jgi:anaerobic selenocysteine-containing dehydrogenase
VRLPLRHPGDLEDGRVRFIRATADHPVNQGVLCAKGSRRDHEAVLAGEAAHPMIRRPGTERGAGVFDPISWDDALDLLTARLRHIRATDPKRSRSSPGATRCRRSPAVGAAVRHAELGRPRRVLFGEHGGGGLYSIGYSFWEFGAPDWDRARYFMLWGVAEDHTSNPIKIGLDKLKRNGAKFVSVNPVRTGYSAVADEWVPVRPGTDGLLALAMVHVLLSRELFDWSFLIRRPTPPGWWSTRRARRATVCSCATTRASRC